MRDDMFLQSPKKASVLVLVSHLSQTPLPLRSAPPKNKNHLSQFSFFVNKPTWYLFSSNVRSLASLRIYDDYSEENFRIAGIATPHFVQSLNCPSGPATDWPRKFQRRRAGPRTFMNSQSCANTSMRGQGRKYGNYELHPDEAKKLFKNFRTDGNIVFKTIAAWHWHTSGDYNHLESLSDALKPACTYVQAFTTKNGNAANAKPDFPCNGF